MTVEEKIETLICDECKEPFVVTNEKAAFVCGLRSKGINPRQKCERCQEKADQEYEIHHKQRQKEMTEKHKQDFLENINTSLISVGVGKRHATCSLDNYRGVKPTQRPGFITGPTGSGKTHLAVGYLRQFLINNYGSPEFNDFDSTPRHCQPFPKRVIFINSVSLLWETRNAIANKQQEDVLYDYCKCDFLVIDDLGSERVTPWAEEIFSKLIYDREAEILDTLITSNLSLSELAELFNPRLASRIKSFGVTSKITGADMRGKA
jgi:DNA replication protein DnaC